MRKRTLAIGDIHGCLTAFEHLLNYVQITPLDQIITLGDYVDRGPDSKGVLDRLIQLHATGQLIALQGNHEVMMVNAMDGTRKDYHFWLSCGGVEALQSYEVDGNKASLADIPANHRHFLNRQLKDWYETETHLFVHANLRYDLPMDEQPSSWLNWEFFDPKKHVPHVSGKVMVCGHSTQMNGYPLHIPSAICIDTFAYGGGWLTCLDVETGEYWQTNELGDRRPGNLEPLL